MQALQSEEGVNPFVQLLELVGTLLIAHHIALHTHLDNITELRVIELSRVPGIPSNST